MNVPSQSYGPYPPGAQPPGGRNRTGKGCLIAFLIGLGLLVLLGACGAIISAGSDPSEPGPAGTEPTRQQGKSGGTSKAAKVTNGIGREYRDGKFAFTVTKVKKGVKRVGGDLVGASAQGQFILVYVTVKNIGGEARTFDSGDQTLIDARKREFKADGEATIAIMQDSKAFLEDINPGNSVKGILIFDVPASGITLKALELHDSPFSGGVTIPLADS